MRSKAGVPPRQELELRVFPRQRRLVDILLEQVLPQPGDNGLRARIDAQRDAKQQLPLALSAALARLPLALLFLPPDEALALLPGMVEVE